MPLPNCVRSAPKHTTKLMVLFGYPAKGGKGKEKPMRKIMLAAFVFVGFGILTPASQARAEVVLACHNADEEMVIVSSSENGAKRIPQGTPTSVLSVINDYLDDGFEHLSTILVGGREGVCHFLYKD